MIGSALRRTFVLAAPIGLIGGLAATVPEGPLAGIMDAALLSMAAAVVVRLSPAIWRAGYSGGVRRLALGVMLMVCGLVVLRGYAIAWRAAGRPESWYPNSVGPVAVFVVAYGLATCEPCKTYDPILEEIAAKFPDVKVGKAKMHVPGRCREIKKTHTFETYPTTHFFSNGKLLLTREGVVEPAERDHVRVQAPARRALAQQGARQRPRVHVRRRPLLHRTVPDGQR